MDEYGQYLSRFDFRFMPENYKVVSGQKPMGEPLRSQTVRVLQNSFALLNISVLTPDDGQLLVAERPAFSYRHPVELTSLVVRAALSCDLPGKLHLVDKVEDDDGLKKADVLLETESMEVRAFQAAQLTAILPIPEGTKPGTYEGKITFYAHSMFYDERVAAELNFTVQAEAAALPAPQDGAFYLNLWQHVFNIARKAEVRAYTDAHLNALRPYVKALAELGGRAATVLLSDIPWCGQRCFQEKENASDLYEYNFVRIRKTREGVFTYDFSFADRYIALCREYGIPDIMFTGLYGLWVEEKMGFDRLAPDWPDAIRLSYTDETDGCIRFMRSASEIEAYFRAVYSWMQEKDYLSCGYLMGDEVDLPGKSENWPQMLKKLHELMPDVRMNWDMVPSVLLNETYQNERVDIYTPQLDAIANKEEQSYLQKALSRVRPGGKKLWSVCCWPPVLNSFLYTDLSEVRLHGLITEYVKMDGFIRWNFTVWPEDPRRTLVFFRPGWPAGDTCFVYPGKGGQCLKSLRYYALRRGIEDYELCRMLRRSVPNADAVIDEAMNAVLREKDLTKWDFANFDGREDYFSLDAADYEKARNILTDALLANR